MRGTLEYGDHRARDVCEDCGNLTWRSKLCSRCAALRLAAAKEDEATERKLRNHRLHKAHWAGGVIGAYMRELCSLEVARAEREIRAEKEEY